MIERKNYGITPLCELGKGKFIAGAADFGAEARRGHGFHTRPSMITYVDPKIMLHYVFPQLRMRLKLPYQKGQSRLSRLNCTGILLIKMSTAIYPFSNP